MDNTVVVRFDGSPDAEAALAWGLALAERHRAGVRIVRAFDPPQHRLCRVDTSCTYAADEHYQQAQEQLLQARDRSRDDHPHLDISSLLAQASPMDLLIEQSWNADTVVLGTRGRARRSELLAGSTALSVSAHARCPVVAVRGGPAGASPGRAASSSVPTVPQSPGRPSASLSSSARNYAHP